MHNTQLYEKGKKEPMSVEMNEERWITFGYCLQLPTNTSRQQAKTYHIECPHKAKKFRGRKLITLPVFHVKDIVKAAKCHRRLQIDI